MLTREINLLTMQQEISTAAQGEMNKSQREYFLRQQLKAIQSELGEGEELAEEVENYRKKIEEKQIPQEAREEVEKQIKRLERSHPDSAETSIIRTYLDWMTGLPWGVHSQDNHDLARAREILDEDHYDLEKIKERILEYLAVRKLKGTKMKGPILCFVGPPGVGKTSLGRSIARALDRVLRAGHYWVPHWYKAAHNLAFWDRFGWPETKPKYERGALETWWYDEAKAQALASRK